MNWKPLFLDWCRRGALLGLLLPTVVGAVCNPNIPLYRPDQRYVDHQDGTVTDRVTGLMWQQCAEGMSSGAALCDSGTAETFVWQQALQRAQAVNASRDRGGHDDWRVPTLQELKSLVELACYNPAINTRFFPRTPARFFWSATPVVSLPEQAWSVGFFYGGDGWEVQSGARHLRLVRGGR